MAAPKSYYRKNINPNLNANRLHRYISAVQGTAFNVLNDEDTSFSFFSAGGNLILIKAFKIGREKDKLKISSSDGKFSELSDNTIGVGWYSPDNRNAIDNIPFFVIHPKELDVKSYTVTGNTTDYEEGLREFSMLLYKVEEGIQCHPPRVSAPRTIKPIAPKPLSSKELIDNLCKKWSKKIAEDDALEQQEKEIREKRDAIKQNIAEYMRNIQLLSQSKGQE